jgi:indole-3-glycerol phosphate synthase
MSILDQLIAEAHIRAELLDGDVLRRRSGFASPPRDFVRALQPESGLAVIAEVKRRSPSAGDIDAALDPVAQARSYAAGGAAAISVLTEPDHFGGSLDDLRHVRAEVDLPVLRKDFIVSPDQVFEARVAGADAILLIVAALDDDLLARLLALTQQVGMAALVEAHDRGELERALEAGAEVIGVNNRNLATFEVDLATAESLGELLGEAVVAVAESGIHGPDDAARMASAGYGALLVGEALVRAPDPAALVTSLRQA